MGRRAAVADLFPQPYMASQGLPGERDNPKIDASASCHHRICVGEHSLVMKGISLKLSTVDSVKIAAMK